MTITRVLLARFQMKNSNNDKENEIDEEFTDPDDLLQSLTYGARKFCFQGSEDLGVGVILEETVDSFLVAMPARIISEKGRMTLISFDLDNMPYIRLMKAAVRSVAFPTALQRERYVEYLKVSSPSVFPDLLDMIELTDFHWQLKDGEIPFKVDDEFSPMVAQGQTAASSINHEYGASVNGPSLTDSDVEEKVKKAMAAGCFITPHKGDAH
jgi:hypothetical protein